ncbi:MAG: hypothetical protein RQ824_10105 [bacterium]|nr:hypothetical protein [bacterium]
MSDLSIRKGKANITAVFVDGTKIRGEVFLASFSQTHYGHQKVSDIIEGDKLFIPVSIKDEERVEFLNRDQVMILEGELSSPEDEEKLAIGLYHIQKVRVIFINGEIMEGAMISESPPERSRLSDCLNLPERFISMIKGGRYFYLNKKSVVRVESMNEDKPAETTQAEEANEDETNSETEREKGIPDDTLIS